ncbi:MAG: ATP12 family protein [Pseudomonadota bacterium]
MRDILSDLHAAATNPIEAARQASKTPLPKRFYKVVTVSEADDGFAVELDGRAVKTPGRNPVVLATQSAARMLADEFDAQAEELDPKAMPVYRLLNTALDGVATDPQAVAEDIIRFSGTDLLCYRADGPEKLVERQSEAWDPVLDWIASKIGSRFILAEGVMHVSQPKAATAGFGVLVNQASDPIQLAGLHSMTTLTGSALLAYAVYAEELSAAEAWAAAHVDEDFNIEQWGDDAEARAMRDWKWTQMHAAARMIDALNSDR